MIKNFVLYFAGLLTGIVLTLLIAVLFARNSEQGENSSIKEYPGITIFDQPADTLEFSRFEVFQVLREGMALANCKEKQIGIIDFTGPVVLLIDENKYYYDDEYAAMYSKDVEPWEQNITTLKDFDSKWKDMLPQGTPVPTPASGKKEDLYTKVGVYEGAGYQSKGVYRGCQECRMKINEAPVFCPVCRRALERLIRFYTEL